MYIAYPLQVNQQHRTATVNQVTYIRQLIEQLLFTAPGERVNRPDFGGGLMQMIFSSPNDELARANEFIVKGNLQQWLGNLIIVEAVAIEVEDEVLTVTIAYTLRQNQQRQVEQFNFANATSST